MFFTTYVLCILRLFKLVMGHYVILYMYYVCPDVSP